MTVKHERSTNGQMEATDARAAVMAHAPAAARRGGGGSRVLLPVLLMVAGLVVLRRLNRGEEI